jgi:hypothetical protein
MMRWIDIVIKIEYSDMYYSNLTFVLTSFTSIIISNLCLELLEMCPTYRLSD